MFSVTFAVIFPSSWYIHMNYCRNVHYRKHCTLQIMNMYTEAINKWNAMENAIWKIWSFAKAIKKNITKILANLQLRPSFFWWGRHKQNSSFLWNQCVACGCVNFRLYKIIFAKIQSNSLFDCKLVALPLLSFILQTTCIHDNLELSMN